MRKLHESLESKLDWYRKWHQNPTSNLVHYAFLFLFALLMTGVIITFSGSHAMVATQPPSGANTAGQTSASPAVKYPTYQQIQSALSRPITMQYMSDDPSIYPLSQEHQDIQMITALQPSMVGRWAGWWASSYDTASDQAHFARAKSTADDIHRADPNAVLEAAILEYVNKTVNNIAIPAWVFTDLGLPVQKINFDFYAMLYNDYPRNAHHVMQDGAVPDITKPETQLWYYYRARSYIDAGAEAIHLGQVKLITEADSGYDSLYTLANEIRAYGAAHARHGYVFLDAHEGTDNLTDQNNKMIFDFNESPLRPRDAGPALSNVVLEKNYLDSIYGKSAGGTLPDGESVSSAPYLAEFDNYGISKHPGTPGNSDYYVFGYDEITWFSKMAETDRNNWLAYASNWLKVNDPAGHLEMPGRRVTTLPGVPWPGIYYRADDGYGNQVSTISCIWSGSSSCASSVTKPPAKILAPN
ncbi:MAG TPA: hypothetical protein VG694_02650 [Candidatus Paceibacterota bacterium]|nr:hypothetical protein [Candidatus Paceibacterota bacterium]